MRIVISPMVFERIFQESHALRTCLKNPNLLTYSEIENDSLRRGLTFGESLESPKMEKPVAVRGVYESRKRHTCVVPASIRI